MIVLESSQDHATIKDTEICPTLPASMGLGGGYVPMIVQEVEEDGKSSEVFCGEKIFRMV